MGTVYGYCVHCGKWKLGTGLTCYDCFGEGMANAMKGLYGLCRRVVRGSLRIGLYGWSALARIPHALVLWFRGGSPRRPVKRKVKKISFVNKYTDKNDGTKVTVRTTVELSDLGKDLGQKFFFIDVAHREDGRTVTETICIPEGAGQSLVDAIQRMSKGKV